MKRLLTVGLCLVGLLLWSSSMQAQEEGKWTGEIVDMSCYIANGAKGADHADCAKTCVKNGQPMGLLTDDGTLVLLAQKSGDAAPFEALKEIAGEKAEVKGTLKERDGMKMLVVEESKKAGP